MYIMTPVLKTTRRFLLKNEDTISSGTLFRIKLIKIYLYTMNLPLFSSYCHNYHQPPFFIIFLCLRKHKRQSLSCLTLLYFFLASFYNWPLKTIKLDHVNCIFKVSRSISQDSLSERVSWNIFFNDNIHNNNNNIFQMEP